MKLFIYLLAFQLLSISFGFSKDSIAAVKSEEYYSKGLPIPDEWVTPGATLEWLIKVTENLPENSNDYPRDGDVYNILDQFRKSKDYSQLDNLHKFAELSHKKSKKYRLPDTHWQWKSLDWYDMYSEATKVVIADLEKAKAEDEAAGRIPKSRDIGVMNGDGQDGNPRAKGNAADSDTKQKNSRIQPLWWLLAPLLLLLLLTLRIVMRKRAAR